jgi:hypothetical protein
MIREDDSGKNRIAVACLVAGSVATNLALLAIVGFHRGNDTDRYLEGASDLIAGRAFRGPAGWFYIGYNALVALTHALGSGPSGVIAVQILVAACATAALFDLGRELGGRWAGILAASVFIVDYDIARWHVYLLTDSLYISLVPIATWAAHRAVGRGMGAYLGASFILLVTALMRPNGWVMIPIAAIYWTIRSERRGPFKIAAATLVVALCLGGAGAVAAVQFGRARPFDPRAPREVNGQRLPFARAMTLRDRLNPFRMPPRLLTELKHIQPDYSQRHKLMVAAMLTVVYPLAIVGLIRSRGVPLARLMAAVVVCHLLIVCVTFPDRDGRYLLYVFPLLLVFAARAPFGTRLS